MIRKKNQGFSLVELILAIAILAIIMVGVGAVLSSTTGVYTRTRDNVEIQQNDQNAFDLISDKVMQANEIRIGSGGNVYVLEGTGGTVDVDSDGRLKLSETLLLGAGTCDSGNRTPYAFTFLDKAKITDPDGYVDFDFISIYYDAKSGDKYGAYIDTFYYYDNNIYLVRSAGPVRDDSVQDATKTDASGVTLSNPVVANRTELDAWWKNCIGKLGGSGKSVTGTKCSDDLSTTVSTNMKDYLICKDVSTFGGYVNVAENSVYLNLGLEKGARDAKSSGVIRIRNSHVLAPKKTTSDLGDSRFERM